MVGFSSLARGAPRRESFRRAKLGPRPSLLSVAANFGLTIAGLGLGVSLLLNFQVILSRAIDQSEHQRMGNLRSLRGQQRRSGVRSHQI
jgi:hypothetical protein